VCLLQLADFLIDSSVRISAAVTEQLALDQVFRKRRAIDFNKWSLHP
jgi:hypothetical protein